MSQISFNSIDGKNHLKDLELRSYLDRSLCNIFLLSDCYAKSVNFFLRQVSSFSLFKKEKILWSPCSSNFYYHMISLYVVSAYTHDFKHDFFTFLQIPQNLILIAVGKLLFYGKITQV